MSENIGPTQPTVESIQTMVLQGHFNEAIAATDVLLKANKDDFSAIVLKGVCLTRKGDFQAAIDFLKPISLKHPNLPNVQHLLGLSYWKLKNPFPAYEATTRAIRLNPKNHEYYFTLANACLFLYKRGEAEKAARKCLELNPNFQRAHVLLGEALIQMGREQEAIIELQKGLSGDADRFRSALLLASIYRSRNDEKQLKHYLEVAYKLTKPTAPAKLALAVDLARFNFVHESRNTLEEALKEFPHDANLALQLVSVYRLLGLFDKSQELALKAIEIDPKSIIAYFSFAYSKKLTKEDAWLSDKVKALVPTYHGGPYLKSLLYYSLGKYYDDCKIYEEAANAFIEANKCIVTMDGPNAGKSVINSLNLSCNLLMKTFTPSLRSPESRLASQSNKPIFIVGMIRSGTTLAEQIVSSHPQVAAAGELDTLTNGLVQLYDPNQSLNHKKLIELRDQYLLQIDHISGNKPYCTDKMPANIFLLGLIYTIFPNAKIIHCTRNPGDVAVSIYTTPIANAVHAHDRNNVVEYYRIYQRCVAHWEKTLPKGLVHTLNYELLLENREEEVRKLIAFCGLDWDDRCLNFGKTGNAIVTPSTWQARQPLYKTSLHRWKNYEPWFPEFAELGKESSSDKVVE